METSKFVRIYFSRYFFPFYVRTHRTSIYYRKFNDSYNYFSDKYVYKPLVKGQVTFNSRTFAIPLGFFFFNNYYDYSYINYAQNSEILRIIFTFILKLRFVDVVYEKSIRHNYRLRIIKVDDNNLFTVGKRCSGQKIGKNEISTTEEIPT